MSADPSKTEGQPGAGPSEEDLRAAYEAELARISATDMIAQAAVSLLNVGAQRIAGPAGGEGTAAGRDLEQARDAIDAAKALLEILERRIPAELAPLRDALSRLQMAYAAQAARATGPGSQTGETGHSPAAGGAAEPGAPPTATPPPGEPPAQPGPGPAESSGRLWVPGR